MALPFTLTSGFTGAVDNLMQNVTVPDSTLHARSKQYLDVFDDTAAGHVSVRPAWSERIHISSGSPLRQPFTTPDLFKAMFEVADELGLVAGKRYVSAAICVCGEHAARAHAAASGAEMRGALVRALHELSSTWAAFLLWPFHAYGYDDRLHENENDDDRRLEPAGDETPTAESTASFQRRGHLKELVMARDNQHCFVSGGLDDSAYYKGMPGVTRVVYCSTVSIIPAELLPSKSEPNQDIMWGILQRFCGVRDAAAPAQQAQGPANTLLVNGWAARAFSMFLWWLLPTETPDRYEIKNPDPVYNIGHGIPLPSHVTFADHSESGVDLPDRTLLRIHAALAEVLYRSGARNTFMRLRRLKLEDFSRSRRGTVPAAWADAEESSYSYSAAAGGAFWRSVVEYEGPEMCAEVELREAVRALALGNSAGAVSRHGVGQ